jgi:hypothetical protein
MRSPLPYLSAQLMPMLLLHLHLPNGFHGRRQLTWCL